MGSFSEVRRFRTDQGLQGSFAVSSVPEADSDAVTEVAEVTKVAEAAEVAEVTGVAEAS